MSPCDYSAVLTDGSPDDAACAWLEYDIPTPAINPAGFRTCTLCSNAWVSLVLNAGGEDSMRGTAAKRIASQRWGGAPPPTTSFSTATRAVPFAAATYYTRNRVQSQALMCQVQKGVIMKQMTYIPLASPTPRLAVLCTGYSCMCLAGRS